jgi:ribose transport system substrate-binding protein
MTVLLKSALTVLSVAAMVATAPVHAEIAKGDTSSKKIALSNAYAGNAWRQSMLKSWEITANEAVKNKIVSAAPAFTTSEVQATEQAQQIQNLILQGYNAIVVNAASPTALNGTIKRACAAGIVVVSFDGIVTEPCAYRVNFDFRQMGENQIHYVAKQLNGKGNILAIRGMAGVSVDEAIHKGILENTRASSSSVKCTATGQQRSHKKQLPVSCQRCLRSMLS